MDEAIMAVEDKLRKRQQIKQGKVIINRLRFTLDMWKLASFSIIQIYISGHCECVDLRSVYVKLYKLQIVKEEWSYQLI